MPHLKSKISLAVISLGCPKNLVDTEKFLDRLGKNDFLIVPANQPADVCVINTCTFINDAKQESIDTILEVANKKKDGFYKKIVVTGCLAQRYGDELPELLPEVDAFVKIGDQRQMQAIMLNLFKSEKLTMNNRQWNTDDRMRNTEYGRRTTEYAKFIKIAEGCSHRCSYCIIPQIRGPLASQKPNAILQEIKTGLKNGVKEFNLIAQDLNEYGRDLEPRSSLTQLLDLMDKMDSIDTEFWLRLLYMYPLHFPDRLISVIAKSKHILPYVDIPLQHISNNMLKVMNRGSSSKYIHRLIEKLKIEIPAIVLRTTFLVGHPGETKNDFADLKTFVREMEFDRVGVFTFSKEEGTISATLPDQVDEKLALDRKNELLEIQQKISLKKNKQWIGKTVKTLIEGPSKESDLLWQGRFYGQAPEIDGVILINKGTAEIGSFAQVKITDAFEYDLLGEIFSQSLSENAQIQGASKRTTGAYTKST